MFEFTESAVVAAKLKALGSAIMVYGGLAILGGVIKVIFGIQNGESALNACLKYLIVALPVGVLGGWGAESFSENLEFLPFAVAFFGGHISYNVVTSMEQKSTKWLVEFLSGGRLK